MIPACGRSASMYCVKGICPGVSRKGSVKPVVLTPEAAVSGYVPSTRSRHVFAALRASKGMGPLREEESCSKCMSGLVGRPSSRYRKTERFLMLKPTLQRGGRQPVHFISFSAFTSSNGFRVYPMIPLFTLTDMPIRCKSVRISLHGMTQPRSYKQVTTGSGFVALLMRVMSERFFAMPMDAPPGVSFVQKNPYWLPCSWRGPVSFIPVSKFRLTRRQWLMKSR